MKNLNIFDVIGLIVCWAGAGLCMYLTKDGLVQLCSLVSGYYLSKWIILKEDYG